MIRAIPVVSQEVTWIIMSGKLCVPIRPAAISFSNGDAGLRVPSMVVYEALVVGSGAPDASCDGAANKRIETKETELTTPQEILAAAVVKQKSRGGSGGVVATTSRRFWR